MFKTIDFEKFEIRRSNILKEHYLRDVSASFLCEYLSGVLPCEISDIKYSMGALDYLKSAKVKKDYDFKIVSAYFFKQLPWNNFFGEEGETHNNDLLDETWWLFSQSQQIVIKISISSDGYLSACLSSTSIQVLQRFSESLSKFIYNPVENKIGIINTSDIGKLTITQVKSVPVELDLELNYGEKFKIVHESIIKKLADKTSGLYLLHSSPGNGKSYYIKYLSQIVKNRLFIYVPTSMIDAIVQPSLISLLLSYPNSVLVIEDAEQAIISRSENIGNASLVSNILNISDGILGSVLNVALLLTFNTERANIDKALLRKGRLQAEWEFKELSTENAKKLAKKINKNPDKITGPTRLCDIYCLEDVNFHEESKPSFMGFS